MIDITITDQHDDAVVKKLPDLEKVEGIVLYCKPDLFKYDEETAYTPANKDAAKDNKFSAGSGFHYSVDEETIYNCVPVNKQASHLEEGTKTYIATALYSGKTNEKAISVLMLLPEKQDYVVIEKKTIKLIAYLLVKHELTPDNLMRGFDLNKLASPLHLLDRDKWRKFIDSLIKTYNAMMPVVEESEDKEDEEEKKDKGSRAIVPEEEIINKDYDDRDLEKSSATMNDEDARKLYLDYGEKAEEYAKKFEIDHRDIKEILEYQSNEPGEIQTFKTNRNTNFTYTVVQNIPSSTEHCAKAFDTLTGKAEPDSLLVEPIYPDLTVPPGGTITLVDTVDASENTTSSSVALTADEFEKRQQSFNVNDYSDAVKEIKGKPVNNNDAFPVDDKIKELESHIPKVKVDEVAFKLHDCNHPDSVIGPEVAKNFAMVQDEIITIAKRTERRLVRLENILSTVTRNLFRASSRMHINCVYYGGQDVFGKYKCIRCTHNDRINDGQSMTLDQCLSCTRYEPILGQIYAILNDSGTNIAQVLDDAQMGYMSLQDYVQLTRTEELHTTKPAADLSENGNEPKPFKESWEEGFKMDWNETTLENQRPNIAEYEAEGLEASKSVTENENEGTVEDEFGNIITDDDEYESLVFSSEDYVFDSFGETYTAGVYPDSYLGTGASEIRNKIVQYAQDAVSLCKDGKAGYSQGKRQNHLSKAINGISYWDCSSLAEGAYRAGGINTIAGNTKTEFPKCLPSAGGKLMPVDKISEALPGDLIWCTKQSPIPSGDSVNKAVLSQIYHVGIYAGDGEYLHASTDNAPLKEQIKRSKVSGNSKIFAFGRPKELIEADQKAAAIISLGNGFYNYEAHGFSADITSNANKYCEGQAKATMESMTKYKYAETLVSVCNSLELDPYLVLGIIATESAGDPTNRTGSYWGIMQTHKNSTNATSNIEDIRKDIEFGCKHYTKMRSYLRKSLQSNPVLAVHAYNAGNGTVNNACTDYGAGAENVTGGQIASYVGARAAKSWGESHRNEKASYVAKVILRANYLRAQGALKTYVKEETSTEE